MFNCSHLITCLGCFFRLITGDIKFRCLLYALLFLDVRAWMRLPERAEERWEEVVEWDGRVALFLSPVPLWLTQISFLHITRNDFLWKLLLYRVECILYFSRNRSLKVEFFFFFCQWLLMNTARSSSCKMCWFSFLSAAYESLGSLDLELHWTVFLTVQTFFYYHNQHFLCSNEIRTFV